MACLGSYRPSSRRAEVGGPGSKLSFYPVPDPPREGHTMANDSLTRESPGRGCPTCQRELHLDSKGLPGCSQAPLTSRNPGAAAGTGPTLGKWPLSTRPISPPPFNLVGTFCPQVPSSPRSSKPFPQKGCAPWHPGTVPGDSQAPLPGAGIILRSLWKDAPAAPTAP